MVFRRVVPTQKLAIIPKKMPQQIDVSNSRRNSELGFPKRQNKMYQS